MFAATLLKSLRSHTADCGADGVCALISATAAQSLAPSSKTPPTAAARAAHSSPDAAPGMGTTYADESVWGFHVPSV